MKLTFSLRKGIFLRVAICSLDRRCSLLRHGRCTQNRASKHPQAFGLQVAAVFGNGHGVSRISVADQLMDEWSGSIVV